MNPVADTSVRQLEHPYDRRIWLRGGTVIDGTGDAAVRADVLIADGLIAQVDATGETGGATARTDGPAAAVEGNGDITIDATGLIIAPGFIDTHIHSDVHLLTDRQHAASLVQGVTTHIMGQDGLSYAPLTATQAAAFSLYLAAVNGVLPPGLHTDSVAAFRAQFDGSVAVNTAYLVPQGALRFAVAGMADRPLTPGELARAEGILDEALAEGGVGLSTGLSYYPGSYADTDELVALARVAARHDVPYVTHVRSAFTHGRVDPIGEAIEIARRSGARLHISHWRTTPATVGRLDSILAQLDDAVSEGLPVTLDTYPYLHGSGPLAIGLPAWAMADGLDSTLDRLADPAQRAALVEGIERNPAQLSGVFTHVPGHPEYEDRELTDVARERNQSIADMACDLLLAAELNVTFHLGSAELLSDRAVNEQFESDCLELLSRPYTMIGSDGIFVGRNPHERAFSTFAKLLRLARDRAFDLPTLINRMTANAAVTFGLDRHGTIVPGFAADLAVFDARTITDRSTVARPRQLPTGVEYVLVNGELAMDRGQVTGIFAGKALPSATCGAPTCPPEPPVVVGTPSAAAPIVAPPRSDPAVVTPDVYTQLDVPRVVNGWGTMTGFGGSLMDPRVMGAMAQATTAFVEIPRLMRAAGSRIAALLGAPAACLTAGAAAGLAVAAAACMAGTGPELVRQLPDTTGMPSEVLILGAHRFLYDSAVAVSGARLRQVAPPDASHPLVTVGSAVAAELNAAFDEHTAMVLYTAQAAELPGSLPLRQVCEVAARHSVPVVVDAAAELPPKAVIAGYFAAGADLVVLSGGKAIRGPQSSGVVLGRPDLIDACLANNYPNVSIGRPMKLDKETIVGLVAAVELFCATDDAEQRATWEQIITDILAEIPEGAGISAERVVPTIPDIQPQHIPRIYVTARDFNGVQLQQALMRHDPPVAVGLTPERDRVSINPQCLQPSEVPIVGAALRAVLRGDLS